MNHVMIDIESMSTNPGNALVLSIGAVRFGFGENTPLIGNKFRATLDPREQLAMGREVSKKTQTWWQGQSDRAREAWLHEKTMPLQAAMLELSSFMREPELKTVWANGIVFDLANIESLFAACNFATPWEYNMARDVRTIVRTCPVIEERATTCIEGASGIAHDPVDDCVSQVNHLWRYLRELN